MTANGFRYNRMEILFNFIVPDGNGRVKIMQITQLKQGCYSLYFKMGAVIKSPAEMMRAPRRGDQGVHSPDISSDQGEQDIREKALFTVHIVRFHDVNTRSSSEFSGGPRSVHGYHSPSYPP